MSGALRLSLAGVALAAIVVAAALWWRHGMTILLDVGSAIAACF